MTVHRVPPALVSDLWPSIETYVTEACSYHPFLDAEDLRMLTLAGHLQLFVVVTPERRVQGFAAMEVVHYPRRKVANILASGGEDGFLSVAVHVLLPELRVWAAEQGADAFAILGGRPGWSKALQNEGGETARFVTWWQVLGDVQGRRQFRQSEADGSLRAVERGETVSH